jgi:MFS family permease
MLNTGTKLRIPLKGAYYLAFISFILILAAPFISPIWPLFIKGLVGKEAYVGYVSAFITFILFLAHFLTNKVLHYINKSTLFKYATLGYGLSFLGLTLVNNLPQLIGLEIFRGFFMVAALISLGLLLRDLAKIREIGEVEGWSFTVANVAWFVAPLVGGILAEIYSYQTLFIIASVFPLLFFIILVLFPLKIKETPLKNHNHIFLNIKLFLQNRNLVIAALSWVGLAAWWAFIYVFLPLFMIGNGFGTKEIGLVLGLVTVPLIILEVPAGKLADKFGYKKFLFLGFFIIAASVLASLFVSVKIAIALFIIASLGAAFIEPLGEALFFKVVKRDDEIPFYTIFRTSPTLGRIIAQLSFSTILLYSNFKILFVSIIVMMIVAGLSMLFLKERK